MFGPVATTLDRLSAIERGILCPLRSLRVERAVDLSDVAKVRGDFDQASLGRALDRAKWHRACAEVWDEHFAPLKLAGVAYTATVAQAHAISSSGMGGASRGEGASTRGHVGIGGGTASTSRQNSARSKVVGLASI